MAAIIAISAWFVALIASIAAFTHHEQYTPFVLVCLFTAWVAGKALEDDDKDDDEG